MFLVSVTRSQPSITHEGVRLHRRPAGGAIITVATDDFLSVFVDSPHGFSLIESPLASLPDGGGIALSQITYDTAAASLSVFKPLLSGRPIFYHTNAQGEFFCSTHISLLRQAGVPIEENRACLPEFFVYRIAMPPDTLYKDIYQMLPGTRMEVTLLSDGSCRSQPPSNMDLPLSPEHSGAGDAARAADEVLDGLLSTLRPLGPAKDRLAVLLSGGMDSSIIFRNCQQTYNTSDSYSASFSFEPGGEDETEYALSAARVFGSRHTLRQLDVEPYLYSVIESIAVAEVPTIVEHAGAFLELFRNALPREKQIVLNGEGADTFFGLKTHRLLSIQENHRRLLKVLSSPPVLAPMQWTSDRTGRYGSVMGMIRRSRHSGVGLDDPRHLLWSLVHYGSDEWVCDYFNVSRQDIIANRLKHLGPYMNRSPYDLVAALSMICDVGVLEDIWSKIAESTGKVMYYSFSSPQVVAGAARVSWAEKMRRPKEILRQVARKVGVPEFIIKRRKSGFGIARRDWALRGGLFEPLVPVAAKAFDEAEMRKMQSIDLDQRFTFWNMLNYAIWKRVCVNNEPVATLTGELRENLERARH
jgi:asparagine synthetase B (glutamine-hydrolysing)